MEENNKKTSKFEKRLKKIESLKRDKEHLEEALNERNNQDYEKQEYKKDLEKINAELDSLKAYEEELNGINAEIGEISEKYNIKDNEKENEIYSKYSDENANIHHIKMDDGQEVILVEDIEDKNQFNIDGMKTYMYNVIGKEDKAKVIYLDEDLDFDMINKDDKYAYIVKDFLSPARIERLSSQEAKGKGVVDFLYVGNIHKDQENEIGYKIGEARDEIYNKISKKEYEYEIKCKNVLENHVKNGENEYRKGLEISKNNLESIINQRPDLYKENIKEENTTDQRNSNTINRTNTVEQNYNSTNKPNRIENTSIVEYKKENRIIAWIKNRFYGIKEKINSIKGRFSKSKNNKEEVELNELGQAWQDYIDMQEGKQGKESKAKRFKEGLHVKGQQLKQSEIARKLTRQNEKDKKSNQFEAAKKLVEEHGIQQEDDERDL